MNMAVTYVLYALKLKNFWYTAVTISSSATVASARRQIFFLNQQISFISD